ncbi:hypothetical protein XELAEV_18026001mg [Xenopus laevis]|uniref:Uncharacterized protein n=1 Tax=Xenopus laevis TaxID=8355 RepID=A0A974D0M3_XENLA|nr:hypothetical protein XELAEV_18026001mg [Xenopus laevis]
MHYYWKQECQPFSCPNELCKKTRNIQREYGRTFKVTKCQILWQLFYNFLILPLKKMYSVFFECRMHIHLSLSQKSNSHSFEPHCPREKKSDRLKTRPVSTLEGALLFIILCVIQFTACC